MVKFTQKLDSAGKIYLPKILRDAGLSPEVDIVPNSIGAVINPAGRSPHDVLESLRAIIVQLETQNRLGHRQPTRKKKKKKKKKKPAHLEQHFCLDHKVLERRDSQP